MFNGVKNNGYTKPNYDYLVPGKVYSLLFPHRNINAVFVGKNKWNDLLFYSLVDKKTIPIQQDIQKFSIEEI